MFLQRKQNELYVYSVRSFMLYVFEKCRFGVIQCKPFGLWCDFWQAKAFYKTPTKVYEYSISPTYTVRVPTYNIGMKCTHNYYPFLYIDTYIFRYNITWRLQWHTNEYWKNSASGRIEPSSAVDVRLCLHGGVVITLARIAEDAGSTARSWIFLTLGIFQRSI